MASIAFLFNPATAPYADNYLTPFKVAAPSFGVEAITPVQMVELNHHCGTGPQAE